MKKWTANAMPDQSGRTFLVTGANSGLGWETSLALARKNAHVVMTSRSMDKGHAARMEILKQVPNASLDVMQLDLASLANVRAFVDAFKAKYHKLDGLINNAGVMAIPREETVDGFEMQFATNHLGPFALTGWLLDVLLKTPQGRVVTVSSSANYTGDINFDDLMGEKAYTRYGMYSQTKLANVLFAFELQRKLEAADASTMSLAVHPGLANTNLQRTTYHTTGSVIERTIYQIVMPLLAHSQAIGALPQLYAATAPDVDPHAFIGVKYNPLRGHPRPVKAAKQAYDVDLAARLWKVSEELTGVHYTFEVPVAEMT